MKQAATAREPTAPPHGYAYRYDFSALMFANHNILHRYGTVEFMHYFEHVVIAGGY